MSETSSNQQFDEAISDSLAAKSVTTPDGTSVVYHDPDKLQDAKERNERKEAFATGKLIRFRRINLSGGIN